MRSYYLLIIVFSIIKLSAVNIATVSIPKCGTFLIQKCISLITNKEPHHFHLLTINENNHPNWNTHFATNHELPFESIFFNFRKLNIKTIFIIRDPRDQLVSHAFYVKKLGLSSLSINDLISDMIRRNCFYSKSMYNPLPRKQDIDTYYRMMLPWSGFELVYTTRFEDLVGSRGGGNDEIQLCEIIKIAKYLGIDLSLDVAKDIANNLFGASLTFRKGQIGAWKEHFNHNHKMLFKKIAGNLLIDLGYEADLNW